MTGTRLYVNTAAAANGDGSSWATAYTDLQTALANARLCSVSYTHLDVYKRQGEICTGEVVNISSPSPSQTVPMSSIGSVSYTHLDVYKRQPQPRDQHPAPVGAR